MDKGFHIQVGGNRSSTVSHGPHAALKIVSDSCTLNIHIADGKIHINGFAPIVIEPRAANAIIIRGESNE